MSPGEATPDSGGCGDHSPAAECRRSPVTVVWSERLRLPIAFVWQHRRRRIERILETWIIETGWWKDDGFVSCSFWRVRAEGRVFELRYNRLTKSWTLERTLN